MNVKNYLSQAYWLDQRINNKLEQVANLRDMATKATASIHAERVSGTKQRSPMENAIVKIIDLEHDINNEIDKLIDLKREIVSVINKVQLPEHGILLELRYLNFKTWEEIADIMNFSWRNIHYVHSKALIAVEKSQLCMVLHSQPKI
ncbi:DUF1492 domain-containing protein [Desulfosporosinus sp.]|uniref:DUF1492 domain-containing protein n=1 Tax=Desulfosporosinus sp. TaxID=157907 RepID=UPI0025BD7750|nr:DUF1492 domain-containing protein [Desulfosporosinus sp.]MBC2723239.1 DUF1492 domain-containing protein [Desulfosporosinus sp.]MBC2727114.1 DUF1492 domain-containing protein [Desulfosporosinus sp.]